MKKEARESAKATQQDVAAAVAAVEPAGKFNQFRDEFRKLLLKYHVVLMSYEEFMVRTTSPSASNTAFIQTFEGITSLTACTVLQSLT